MRTFVIADSNIPSVLSDAGLYGGIAYSYLSNNVTTTYNGYPEYIEDDSTHHHAGMFQLGYKFNPYIALEGRYWVAKSKSDKWKSNDGSSGFTKADSKIWGIYLKPIYPITSKFNIYALLGLANNNYNLQTSYPTSYTSNHTLYSYSGLNNHTGFSWGLGASYSINRNILLFIDYTKLHNNKTNFTWNNIQNNIPGTINITTKAWNFGITYKF